MKNLQDFGVQELKGIELTRTSGGWLGRIARAVISFGMRNNHVYEEQAARGVDISPIY